MGLEGAIRPPLSRAELSVCSGLKMKRQSRTLRLAIESYPIGLYRPAAKNSTIGR